MRGSEEHSSFSSEGPETLEYTQEIGLAASREVLFGLSVGNGVVWTLEGSMTPCQHGILPDGAFSRPAWLAVPWALSVPASPAEVWWAPRFIRASACVGV